MSIECYDSNCNKHNKYEPFCDEKECMKDTITKEEMLKDIPEYCVSCGNPLNSNKNKANELINELIKKLEGNYNYIYVLESLKKMIEPEDKTQKLIQKQIQQYKQRAKKLK